MIPEAPLFYRLAIIEIAKTREEANQLKSLIDKKCDEDVSILSGIISRKREKCPHNGVILHKESISGRPHEPDVYICSLCTGSLQHPPISSEIVRVSQEELLKFFCK